MIRRLCLTLFSVCAALNLHAVTTNDAATAETEGRELVNQLLSARPEKDFTNSGTVRILANKRVVEVPVVLETFVTATNWQTRYYIANADRNNTAAFSVTHAENRSNEYHVAKLNAPASDTNDFIDFCGVQVFTPFAGSDFWLADLGLEFLHWPGQKIWRRELKKGQSCAVLESRPAEPATNGYSRVVSWIDIDTGGIVQAEAYDPKGKLLKEFDVKELEKINGRLEVSEIQMRNTQTGSRTQLRFNFEKRK